MMKEPTYFDQLVQQSLEQTGVSFENWWNSEGSEMTFESTDDLRRIAETAWRNGSFLQSMKNSELVSYFAKDNERQRKTTKDH